MARKLGDLAIGSMILLACIVAFSTFINSADEELSVSSGIVGSSLGVFNSSLRDIRIMEQQFVENVDNITQLVSDEETDKEDSAGKGLGILNIFSKNILVKFFKEVAKEVPGANFVVYYILIPLLGIAVTIIFIRVWRGETKIWTKQLLPL